jgi:hypothetical protein
MFDSPVGMLGGAGGCGLRALWALQDAIEKLLRPTEHRRQE